MKLNIRKIVREEIQNVMNEGPNADNAMLIGRYTGLNRKELEKFMDEHDLDGEALLHYVGQDGSLKNRLDVTTALAGNPGNKIQKMIIKKFSK